MTLDAISDPVLLAILELVAAHQDATLTTKVGALVVGLPSSVANVAALNAEAELNSGITFQGLDETQQIDLQPSAPASQDA